MSTYPPLPCERITYRAVLYPEFKDKKGLPKWQAFKLRKADTDGGASLGLTVERCVRDLEEHHGILTVHVGHVRAASDAESQIDVILNDPENDPEHASITGLPYLFDENGEKIVDIQLQAKAHNLAVRILEHVLEHMRKHSITI